MALNSDHSLIEPSLDDRSDHAIEEKKVAHHDIEERPRHSSHLEPLHVGTRESEEPLDVGRQVELEAENAIRYRTCSWEKVGSIQPSRQFRFGRCLFIRIRLTTINIRRRHYSFPSIFAWR
jgi:hypothetical protein